MEIQEVDQRVVELMLDEVLMLAVEAADVVVAAAVVVAAEEAAVVETKQASL